MNSEASQTCWPLFLRERGTRRRGLRSGPTRPDGILPSVTRARRPQLSSPATRDAGQLLLAFRGASGAAAALGSTG